MKPRLHWMVAICLGLASGCSLFGGDDASGTEPDGGVGAMCTSNDECGSALVCAGGRCQLAGSVGQGAACWATRDCEPGLHCRHDGICAPAGDGDVGDPCVTADQCQRGLVCDLFGFSGQCAEAGTGDLDAACSGNADCLAGLACGPDGTCGHPLVVYPPFTGVECEPDEETFKAYFEVPRDEASPADFYRLPFPNDARVDGDGSLDLSDFPRPGQSLLGVDLVDLYADALVEDFAGFSAVAPVSIRFSKELDFDSVTPESLHFVDVTAGAPTYGDDRDRSWSYRSSPRLYHCQHFFTIGHKPHQPLLPGHTYAVYLTNSVRSAADDSPVQDDDLTTLLGDARPTDDARMQAAWDAYQPFRDYLDDEGVATTADEVAALTVFTVQDTTGRAERLAAAVADTAAPELVDLTLCDGETTSPCEDDTGRGACGDPNGDFHEIHGRFTVPVFQEGTPPYERPEDGGAIAEVEGVPTPQGSQDVCFALSIPKSGTMPVGGWPLVVYAHGTGGSFRGAMGNGVASALATSSEPTAVFSYDGVVHGERRNGSMHSPDELMFNVLNPRAARDNNLQGAVDVLHALRLPALGAVELPGAGSTSFDAARSYYFGHSQGSNVGIPAVAVSDATGAAIFSGAGSHLIKALLTKTSPVDAKSGLEFVVGEELNTDHPVMVIWQTFFDTVDTVNFAPLLIDRPPEGVPSKHVFMSWGPDDTFSPPATLNATARAARLPVVTPVIQDLDTGTVSKPFSLNRNGGDGQARTAACFQYEPDGYDGHFVATRHPGAIADWLQFLASAISTGDPSL